MAEHSPYENPEKRRRAFGFFDDIPNELYGEILGHLDGKDIRSQGSAHRQGRQLAPEAARRKLTTDWEAFKTYYIRHRDSPDKVNEAISIVTELLTGFFPPRGGNPPHSLNIETPQTTMKIYSIQQSGMIESSYLARYENGRASMTIRWRQDRDGETHMRIKAEVPNKKYLHFKVKNMPLLSTYDFREVESVRPRTFATYNVTNDQEAIAKIKECVDLPGHPLPHGFTETLARDYESLGGLILDLIAVLAANDFVPFALRIGLPDRPNTGWLEGPVGPWESQGIEAVFGRIYRPSFPLGATPFPVRWHHYATNSWKCDLDIGKEDFVHLYFYHDDAKRTAKVQLMRAKLSPEDSEGDVMFQFLREEGQYRQFEHSVDGVGARNVFLAGAPDESELIEVPTGPAPRLEFRLWDNDNDTHDGGHVFTFVRKANGTLRPAYVQPFFA